MRDILFRAKRIDNGEWVEGFLLIKYYQELPHDRFAIQYKTKGDEYEWTPKYLTTEIDPETICQYTGLTDKNGNKIWENDVVSVEYSDGQEDCRENAQVVWSKKDTGFSPFNWQYECEGCDLYCNILEVIVIGNIFDNPDLLKGE